MSFRDAFKRRTPGFAGGTLEEQLMRDALLQSQNGQVLTPQNQEAITRPRTVTPAPEENLLMNPPAFKKRFAELYGKPRVEEPAAPPEQEGFGSSGEPFGSVRMRRTQPRDVIADEAQGLRDLQLQPRTWRDKTVDVLDAISTGLGNRPRSSMTKRERQIAESQGRLGTELTVGQKQNAIRLGEMVPVTLEDGSVVEVPARGAGTLQSQQQRIRAQADQNLERKRVNSARIDRWERMDSRDRKRLLADLYKSGGTNDPEQLEYIADQLGIPGTLRPKFIQGQMRDAVDEDGNLIQINRQTQEVLSTGEKSYETTKEAGRNRRFAEGQAGATSRAGMRGTGTGAGAGRKITAGERKDIAETSAVINQVHRQLTALDSEINALTAKGANASAEEKAQLVGLGRKRKELVETGALEADKLNQIDPDREWGSGTGGYPYSKPKPRQGASGLDKPIVGKPVGGKYAGRRISKAKVPEFAKRHGMTTEEAMQFLSNEKAIVY